MLASTSVCQWSTKTTEGYEDVLLIHLFNYSIEDQNAKINTR